MNVNIDLPESFQSEIKNMITQSIDEVIQSSSSRILNIEQFANKVGVCKATARRICQKLPSPVSFCIGSNYRINEKLFDDWIAVKENAVKLERI